MYTENHIHFDEDLINRTGFYIWMHSTKCRLIRIGFYLAMIVSAILAFVGLLRHFVLHTNWTMTLVFLVIIAIMLISILIIWPLVFRAKAISTIHADIDQIVTMDEKSINLHTTVSHQQYKWHNFTDMEEDDKYYFLFSTEVYIILDKRTFPAGGEKIFRELRTPAHLLRESARKTRKQRYLMLTDKDYLTPIVTVYNRIFKKR